MEENVPETDSTRPNTAEIYKQFELDFYFKIDGQPFNDQEAIYQLLKEGIDLDFSSFDSAYEKLNDSVLKVDYYKAFLFNRTPNSDDNRTKRNSNEDSNNKVLSQKAELKAQEESKAEKHQLTLENASNYRFNENKFQIISGAIEPAQVYNKITQKMNLNKGFLKYWILAVRSEASGALLLDSFWWFYIKYFKKDPELEEDLYKYFCRISESYVALFLSIDSSMRDKIIQKFPSLLSQAIYYAFYESFPDSRLQFNNNFKQEICDVVYQWTLGVSSMPDEYKQWAITEEEYPLPNTDIKPLMSNQSRPVLQKVLDLEKTLNALSEEPQVHFEEKINESCTNNQSSNKDSVSLSNKVNHPGKENLLAIKKYAFNLNGKSVLIQHYFKMYGLVEHDACPTLLNRNEIVK